MAKEEQSKRDKAAKFLKKNLAKGELAVKHAVGLGPTPNVVPPAPPVFDGPPRRVKIGWHPVGGGAGRWLAEETALGRMIAERINEYPDPTQHWAVLVGDYAHQLWMDENFHVIYTNERIRPGEWRTFEAGQTTFNDDAIRRAGEAVIRDIRSKNPSYNLITNNCQTYVLRLLDAIQAGVYRELGTTQAVYEKLTGRGKVAELFSAEQAGEQMQGGPGTVPWAQQLMRTHTAQLDPRREVEKKHGEKGLKSLLARFGR